MECEKADLDGAEGARMEQGEELGRDVGSAEVQSQADPTRGSGVVSPNRSQ